MVRVLYDKLTKKETSEKEEITLVFKGETNGMKYDLKVKGMKEQTDDLLRELKITNFDQMAEVKLSNPQRNLSDHTPEDM